MLLYKSNNILFPTTNYWLTAQASRPSKEKQAYLHNVRCFYKGLILSFSICYIHLVFMNRDSAKLYISI